MNPQKAIALLMAGIPLLSQVRAQEAPVSVERPKGPIFVRPYMAPATAPVRLKNSGRLYNLIRAGKLYLTVQDAIALAIENNLDLEVERYNPLIAEWQVERSQAGGLLRGVTSGNTQVGQVASGQGISGSLASAGLNSGGGAGGGGGASQVVSQIGPVTANLDPVLQNTTLFSHTTNPQVNTVQSQTNALVDTSHIYNSTLQEGLLSGGYVQLSARESYLKENTPTDVLNPSVAPRGYLYAQHNFLSGFGVNVNSRFIRIAQKNAIAAQQTFRSQLLDLVANVLHMYWGMVADNEGLKARRRAQEVAQKFYEDTEKEIRIGDVPRVEIYRAQAEVATRTQEFTIAQAAARQQENLLKNVLSRNGTEDLFLDDAEIIPLDTIQVPEVDDLPLLREMVSTALAMRPDLKVTRIQLENAEISALGTANGVLPQLTGFAQAYGSGLSGTAQTVQGIRPSPQFVGGFGNALGQVLRFDSPNYRAGAYTNVPLWNHIDQGDYGVDQLQLRQTQLMTRRTVNQIVVDISNQVVALRQARARYSAAVDTRSLQALLLEKEQTSFSLGNSTISDVIGAQRNLVTAETTEISALAAYAHARVGLDQILGETLAKNNVSVDDALKGRVATESKLPPAPAK
jgi:outer membrane protein